MFHVFSVRHREEGTEVLPPVPIPGDSCGIARRRDAALYFNQIVWRRFLEAKARNFRRGETLDGSPWNPVLDDEGNARVGKNGIPLEGKTQFFPLPFVEMNKAGFLFDIYKDRYVRYVLNLVIKMMVALDFGKDSFEGSLYLCGGTPRSVSQVFIRV